MPKLKAFQGQNGILGKLYASIYENFGDITYISCVLFKCSSLCSWQVRTAGSNALFAALTEISDNVLSGAETNGLNGMVMVKLV